MFLGRKYNAHVLTMRKRGRADDGHVQVFVNLDNGYNREDSVKDIGALLDCTCFVFFAWVRLCAVALCGLTCIVFLVYFPSGLVLLRPDSRSLKESHTCLDCGRDRCRCLT